MDEKTPINESSSIQTSLIWGGILDELRVKESLTSDTSLARSLGVSRGYISLIRMGKKGLSPRLVEEIFKRLGREQDIDAIEALITKYKIRSRMENFGLMRQFVLDRANGVCQLCGNHAPFSDRDGRPYLEIYQVQSIKNGGPQAPKNLVAICPNCKTKMRVNPTEADLEKLESLVKDFKNH